MGGWQGRGMLMRHATVVLCFGATLAAFSVSFVCLQVEADALVGQAQLQMRAKEWGPAEELLGSALKAAEGGSRSYRTNGAEATERLVPYSSNPVYTRHYCASTWPCCHLIEPSSVVKSLVFALTVTPLPSTVRPSPDFKEPSTCLVAWQLSVAPHSH